MKTLAKIFLIICVLPCLNLTYTFAATTYTWTGSSGTNANWNTPANWKVGTVVQTVNYPGSSASTDIVEIGVTASFTVQPVLTTAVTIGSLTIGTQTASTLSINNALTVTGNITQMNNSSVGGIVTNLTSSGGGSISCANFNLGDATQPPLPTLGFGLGNATYQTILNFSSISLTVAQNLSLTTTSNTTSIGNILFHQPSGNVNNPVFNFNSGLISVGNAIQTIDANDVNIDNYMLLVINYADVSSSAQFLINPTTGNTANLILKGATPLSLDGNAGYVDFYGTAGGISTVNYNGSVNQEVYTSSAPYNTASRFSSDPVGLDRTPSMYQNLICSNTLVKKADPGNLTVGGDFTIIPTGTATVDFATNSPVVTIGGNFVSGAGATLNQGGTGTMSVTGTSNNTGTINQTGSGNITFGGALNNSTVSSVIAQTNTGAIIANGGISNSGTISQGSIGTIGSITVTGSLTNSGTITQKTGNISVSADLSNTGTLSLGSANLTISGNYTNNGTYTQSTGTTLFNGSSAETLQDGSGAGTIFKTVSFSGAGTKTISSGNFSVASTSVLTMIGTSSLSVTTGSLTLNSDANGSAIVAALPAGASILGTVNVQRFIQGSSADLTKRGYRLLTSTVYTASDGTGTHVFDLNYILNGIFVSGLNGTINGFNITTPQNNPSIYLFREDDPFPANNFVKFYTNYNWKGVASLNNSNAYDIGIQKKLTATNLADTTTTIPVGNGMLVYFRGDKTLNNNTNGGGSKIAAPFNFPENVTLMQTGTLNTGTIAVKLWFANAAGLGNNLSFTAANVSTASTLTGGFTCVGNPYPSTINWEKYNNTNAPGAITGTGTPMVLPSKIWVYDVVAKQYYSYIPIANGTDLTTEIPTGALTLGSASNFIAGGEAFFIKATQKGQTLSFNETAKISAQPVKGPLSNLMGKPKAFAVQPKILLRMKLIKDSINTDEMLIALSNSANAKFADNEDAEDLRGDALVTLSSSSSDSVKLGINSYPWPGIQPEVILVTADASSSGSYQLVSTQPDNLPILYDVWLKDAFTNDSLSLKTNVTYQFTIDKTNPATFGSNRFTVVIRQDTTNFYRLLSFTANKINAGREVQLVWKTKNEENYTNFTVERSVNRGKAFVVIGGLRGTDAGRYSILDKTPVTGQNLYRLKQQDINDSITYSRVIAVQYTDRNNDSKVRVYPNPATNTINVAITPDAGERNFYTIRITNSCGLLIRQITSPQNVWQANVARLLPGTYIVKVHNGKDNSFIGDAKFVKL